MSAPADAHAALARLAAHPRGHLCARVVAESGGPQIAGVHVRYARREPCGLPLPCAVHDARHACRHGQPLDGDCDACEATVRAAPQGALADMRLRLVAAGEACEVEAVRVERGYWMRRFQAVHEREAVRRKALAALVTRYRADAGEPEPGSPEAAVLDVARAWSERCVVCGEDEPDAPRVAGRERHVYCSDACAESADCRACLGDGFEGPRENDVPCGECRSSDRLHYEAQQDEDARDREEQRRVDEARGK